MDNSSKKCPFCDSKFRQKKNLYAHLRKFHKIEPFYSKSEKNIVCKTCDRSFSSPSSLFRHERSFHKFSNDHDYLNKGASRKKRLKCPYENCQEEHLCYDNLRQHLVLDHEVEIQFENLTFDSMKDFESWRHKIQQETLSFYAKDTGSKALRGGGSRLFMNCHRSYGYNKKGKNLRAIKSTGSNKMGKACPSRLEVTINENADHKPAVSVIYWKTHYGHTQEIKRMTLDKDVRLEIAEMLEDGVTFDEMLEGIHKTEDYTGISPRLLLLDRKDMHNIVRDFKIDKFTKLK